MIIRRQYRISWFQEGLDGIFFRERIRNLLLEMNYDRLFVTRNFLHFLTLYGHFAGEDLEDWEEAVTSGTKILKH